MHKTKKMTGEIIDNLTIVQRLQYSDNGENKSRSQKENERFEQHC